MVRIPSEYQEVEYLESNGTQYFWTDIDIQDGLTVDSVQTMATGNDSYLFGGQCESGVVSGKTCFNGNYSNKVQGAYTNNYYLVGTVVQDNQTKYHIVSTHADSRRICVVDGVQVLNSSADAFVATIGKCVCFGWNKVGTPANFYKGKIYSLKVSKADELLANFIPCYRKSDNEIGMYDTVTKTFFTNQGTGTFLKGNDVNYDTVNLMESRRRILLNTPHFESLTGSALSFKTDMASKLKECKVYFTPVQDGTGDPSPDNVRPIHGWDGVSLNVNGTSITIPFPQTIYGGYVDLISGEVVETCSLFSYIWDDGTNQSSISDKYRRRFRVANTTTPLRATENICNVAPWLRNYSSGALHFYNENGYAYVFLPQDTSDDAAIEMALELATPTTYHLDPVTIRALRGQNNIWSDANGNIKLKFWTH